MTYNLTRTLLESRFAGRLPHRVRRTLGERALLGGAAERVVLEAPTSAATTVSRSATVLAMGDIALVQRDGGAPPTAERIAALTALYPEGALVTANFEAPIAVEGAMRAGRFGSFLRTTEDVERLIPGCGLSVVNIANNHALDYGAESFAHTRSVLESLGVRTVGTHAQPPLRLEHGGVPFSILAACDDTRLPVDGSPCPVALVDDDALKLQIRCERTAGRVVMLHLHWGFEWSCLPPRSFRDRARAFVDAGAQIVLCHHAHVPLGVELYADGVIAHGLGNAYFPFATPAPHPLREASQILTITVVDDQVRRVMVDFLWHDDTRGLVHPTAKRLAALHAVQRHANSALEDDARLTQLEHERVDQLLSSVTFWCRAGVAQPEAAPQIFGEARRLLSVPLRRRLGHDLQELGLHDAATSLRAFLACENESGLESRARALLRAMELGRPAESLTPRRGIGWLP